MEEQSILERSLENNISFQMALDIINSNSLGGKVWVIGGLVYRTIIEGLYGTPFNDDCDYDFIIENPKDVSSVPPNWEITRTPLGSPRFLGSGIQIDAVPLCNVRRPWSTQDFYRLSSEEMVDYYCSSVPLTLQAIAYDVHSKLLIGEAGIAAIRSRTVGIMCRESLFENVQKNLTAPRKYLEEKAQSVNFAALVEDL